MPVKVGSRIPRLSFNNNYQYSVITQSFGSMGPSSDDLSSSSSGIRSVADIDDHGGLPILSVVSSLEELTVGIIFSYYKVIQTLSVCFERQLPLILVPHIFPLNICFSSPSALFIGPENCIVFFWWF